MADTDPASAIVVRVPLPRRLADLRTRWVSAASVGVPAAGSRSRRRTSRSGCASTGSGDPGVVYLDPEPSTPFSRLTEAVVARYPGHQPYGGAFAEVIPT